MEGLMDTNRLHLDLHLSMHDPFLSDYLPCPPSSTSSSFSASSSLAHPFTPVSGRSSPTVFAVDYASPYSLPHAGHHLDFTSSPTGMTTGFLCSNDPITDISSTIYQGTPTATTTHFNHGLATPAMPVTPIRKADPLGYDFGSQAENATVGMKRLLFHSSPAELCDISPQQLNCRSDMQQPQTPRSWDDGLLPLSIPNCFISPLGAGVPDSNCATIGSPISAHIDSPLSFHGVPLLPSDWRPIPESPTPRRAARRPDSMARVQKRTNLLQRAQQKQRDRHARQHGIPRPKFFCPVPRCDGSYVRQEHLKRHLRSNHKDLIDDRAVVEDWQCEYCPGKKAFNRHDNFCAHLRLHTKKRSQRSRVKYHEEALERLEHEQKPLKAKSSAEFKAKHDQVKTEIPPSPTSVLE